MEVSTPNVSEMHDVMSRETAKEQLSNIQFTIDVIITKLVDLRLRGLNDFTLKEIYMLEEKLIKRISQQLQTKQQVNPNDMISDLQQYPSLLSLLTAAGVSSVLANGLNNDGKSVDGLLQLNDVQLLAIISKLGGTAEDSKKMVSALNKLKKLQVSRNCNTPTLHWDSWSKHPDEDVFNNTQARHKNLNEKMSTYERGSDHIGSNYEVQQSLPPQPRVISRIRSTAETLGADFSRENAEYLQSHHSRQLPSTSSSCVTPPSPTNGSRSSLDSDSSFSTAHNPSCSSPPPSVTMSVSSSTSINTSCSHTPPITPGTPHKTPPYLGQPNLGHNLFDTRMLSRNRFLSANGGMSLGRPNKLNPTSPTPFAKVKASKSSEYIGNRITPRSEMSVSNPSLSTTSVPPVHPALKSKGHKNRKKRPDDLIIIDDENLPNFINYSRAASRRSSTTVSPESAKFRDSSPLSPRTPLTPGTPYGADMGLKDHDMGPPHTSKTPKPAFRSVKHFFAKFTKRKKFRPQKSTDSIGNDDSVQQPSSRRCSDTPPSSQGKETLRPPDTFSLCTPVIPRHPGLSGTKSMFLHSSASRPSSLIDTGETIVPDMISSNASTLVSDSLAGDTERARESTLTSDPDGLATNDPFRKGNSEEWDIPYDELDFGDVIGRGRVGTVYKGRWHGDVAIRVIAFNHNDEEKLQAFKKEITIYKKTRHENVELFMGSCMHPPKLVIVTGFCRGHSLHNYIRVNKSQLLTVNQAKIIAQHVAQGMGYLHSKGIVHRDLKSKNIFVDGKRIVITDFASVGLHALSSDNSSSAGMLVIPHGWLCYLAPEIIKALRLSVSENDYVITTLPYTMESDVYAFGTVWYELLTGGLPFKSLPTQSIIWQVGSGKTQNLSQLQGGKDVKDMLLQAWSYDPSLRPDFSDNGIMGILKNLQTQILRSLSSHPRRTGLNRGTPHDRLFDGTPLRHGKPFSAMHDLVE